MYVRHTCPWQVAFQGMSHNHTLEVRDRFGNLLDSYENGGFTVTLVGVPDPRAGAVTKKDHVTIATSISNASDAKGELLATFTPEVAGSYLMTNEYTGPGGLLATFYRTKDFMDPVLENMAYAMEVRAASEWWRSRSRSRLKACARWTYAHEKTYGPTRTDFRQDIEVESMPAGGRLRATPEVN